MKSPRRFLILVASIALLGLALTGWAYSRLTSASDRCRRAAAELRDCEMLAQKIQGAAQAPMVVGQVELESAELAGRLEAFARSAAVPLEQIARITPEPVRRIGSSAYVEKITRIELRNVTLPQAMTLLHPFEAGEPPLKVRSLRISMPRNAAASQELWNIEANFSQLIYSPTPTQTGARP